MVDGEVLRAILRGAAVAFAEYSKPTTQGDTALLYDTYELPHPSRCAHNVFSLSFIGLFYTIDSMNYGDQVPYEYQTPSSCNHTLAFFLFLSPFFLDQQW